MSIYSVSGVLLNQDAYVDLVNDKDSRLKFFFMYDEGVLSSKPVFKCQEGLNVINILQTDMYDCTSSLLIFSKNFYNKMHQALKNEVDFFEADLIIEDKTDICYVGKITNIQSILNEEKSEYDDWPDDDEPFIEKAVFKEKISNTNYCVKNNSEQPIEVFTENFKYSVELNNLKLAFQKLEQLGFNIEVQRTRS